MRLRFPKFIPRETLLMALDSIRAHKFRSALTVLGIVIGVIVSIVVASILTGLRANIVRMVEEYGTNNIYAFHLTTGPQVGERDQAERARKPLTAQDGEAIVQQAPAVEAMALESMNIGCGSCGFDDTIKINGRTYPRGENKGGTPHPPDQHQTTLERKRLPFLHGRLQP